MATKKIKAPIGHHFMVRNSDNDFYIMKTNYLGYSVHTDGDYVSALSVDVEFKGTHTPAPTTSSRATATTPTGRTTQTRTTTPTRSTSVNYSNRSSSGGSSSGGY
jgi:hypothetical protein|tara:strand:+ start:1032 stop:1346 length:315 start_codon:yes stop_codon:yes gene_type:complete